MTFAVPIKPGANSTFVVVDAGSRYVDGGTLPVEGTRHLEAQLKAVYV